jgi:hypothetical protein
MNMRARLLTVVAVMLVALLAPSTGAGAAAYPHGPHTSETLTSGSCSGYAQHYVPSSGYIGYAATARYGSATCHHLSARLRCWTIFGTISDTGYSDTNNGTQVSITVYLDSCDELYISDHKLWTTASTNIYKLFNL